MEQVAHELIYRPSAADIERVNRIRREFAPDVDYACELSMARYFGLLDDLDVPLVVAAQGFEVMKRRGVDITPEIHRNAQRIDLVISGSAANVRENIAADVPFLTAKPRVVPYGISTDYLAELSVTEAQEGTRFVSSTSDRDFVVSVLSRKGHRPCPPRHPHSSAGVPARLRLIGDSLDGAAFRSVIEDKIALLRTSDAFMRLRAASFGPSRSAWWCSRPWPPVCPSLLPPPEILHHTARPGPRNDTQLADQLGDVRAVFEEAVAARRQQRTRAPRRLTSDAAV